VGGRGSREKNGRRRGRGGGGGGGLPVTEGSRVNMLEMQYIRRVTSCMQIHLTVFCVYGFLRLNNTAFNLKRYGVIC
jgi:hypothetical protein